MNVRQRRGRHNKNSGREALRPSLGAKPVILHLKWSCKRSQVVLQWDHLHHTNDMMKLCNKQVPTWCFFLMPKARGWDNREREIFNEDWVCLPDEKLIYCRKHNCPLVSSIAAKLCDSLSPNKINEADVESAGLKFKTSCCLKVIKICTYSCRQHHHLIEFVWRYLPSKQFPKLELGTELDQVSLQWMLIILVTAFSYTAASFCLYSASSKDPNLFITHVMDFTNIYHQFS